MIRTKAVMSWSSGKDSAMALHVARSAANLDIVALVSNFNTDGGRVKTHATRREIVRAQARALGLTLVEIDLPEPTSNAAFLDRTREVVRQFAQQGVTDWVFGDLFLQDIRDWREAQMAALGVTSHFPLWDRDTATLARDMLSVGLEAYVVAADCARIPIKLAGARFDMNFLSALPEGVDPSGENGEFHTVVANAPGFEEPLALERGETVLQNGVAYTDFRLIAKG
ncbi:ATP-binding protein [Shimia sp. SDUM112013]|uniref:Dph6-related ATP pyrophosphatase n=1 Tax=Shimia sp. SDUM112013 TaxID=3136160 RepID=UPI0032EE6523